MSKWKSMTLPNRSIILGDSMDCVICILSFEETPRMRNFQTNGAEEKSRGEQSSKRSRFWTTGAVHRELMVM